MPMLKHHVQEPLRPESAPVAPAGDRVVMGKPVVFVTSPARLLHEQLASHFEAAAAVGDDRWPGAARLAVIAGASLALWIAIGGAVALSL